MPPPSGEQPYRIHDSAQPHHHDGIVWNPERRYFFDEKTGERLYRFKMAGSLDFDDQTSHLSLNRNVGSTGKGILIGMLSAFGSALLIALILALVYFFRYTNRGRIFLDRMGRPGEFDDEQAFARDEAEALEEMDDIQRAEYMRAKGTSGRFCILFVFSELFVLTFAKSLCNQIRQSPLRPTYPSRSF